MYKRQDLLGANLVGASLWDADLRSVDLLGADLRDANLRGADLRGADLRDVLGGILQITGVPSGQIILTPTVNGWWLRVGCWQGDIPALRDLIARDDGWPEARGAEVTRRRPILEAAIALAEAHTAAHQDALDAVVAKWGEGK